MHAQNACQTCSLFLRYTASVIVFMVCKQVNMTSMILNFSSFDLLKINKLELCLCSIEICSVTCVNNSSIYVNMFSGLPACVDWNQYYSSCKPNGKNPFQGAICFDNIMYAWVAIFQVR